MISTGSFILDLVIIQTALESSQMPVTSSSTPTESSPKSNMIINPIKMIRNNSQVPEPSSEKELSWREQYDLMYPNK